ncbi:MAG: hypothetical protein HGB12_09090 [Bacteroidetes bacterium]|nr:hypothetical protein [Bacteroidota bacterium]
MNNDLNIFKLKGAFLLFFALIIFQNIVKAQDTVVIVDAYKPTISDAFKMNENPQIVDPVVEKLNFTYSISPKLQSTYFAVEPVKPAKMVGEPLTKFYKSYVKAGFGTKITPLAEFYLGTLRSTNQSVGIYFKHLSSSGKIKNYGYPGFSDNNAGIQGQKFYKNHTLSAVVDYKRNVVHYYGFKPFDFVSIPDANNKDSIKQRFSKIGGQLKFFSTYIDSTKLNHSFAVKYFNLSDLFDATEDYIGFNGEIDKNISVLGKSVHRQNIGLNADVDYYRDVNKINSSNGGVVRLTPHFSAAYNVLKFNLGVNASIKACDNSLLYVYPDVNFSINIYDNIFILYGAFTGEMKRNNIIDLSVENPFINTSLPIDFSNTKTKVAGGFKGSISSNISFNAHLSRSVVNNMPLFINDTTTTLNNKFTVIYDNAEIINTGAEITYQKAEKIKIILSSDYYHYYMSNELEAWHKPYVDVKFSFNYNLKNKIIVKTEVYALSSSKAKTYITNGFNPTPTVSSINLKGTVDFNLGLEYRYSKILSGFVNFNNIGAVRYQRWNNYPAFGFTALAGITYSL